jgi:hypothetical protein
LYSILPHFFLINVLTVCNYPSIYVHHLGASITCSGLLLLLPICPFLSRYLEHKMELEDLLEIKPDTPGGPPRYRSGADSPSYNEVSTSSGGSAWASETTDQPLAGSPAALGGRKRAEGSGAGGSEVRLKPEEGCNC